MSDSRNYRIVMIGPHGERDYVEKILVMGCPCTCGPFVEHAMVAPKTCVENIARRLRKSWLNPHVAVELEVVGVEP